MPSLSAPIAAAHVLVWLAFAALWGGLAGAGGLSALGPEAWSLCVAFATVQASACGAVSLAAVNPGSPRHLLVGAVLVEWVALGLVPLAPPLVAPALFCALLIGAAARLLAVEPQAEPAAEPVPVRVDAPPARAPRLTGRRVSPQAP